MTAWAPASPRELASGVRCAARALGCLAIRVRYTVRVDAEGSSRLVGARAEQDHRDGDACFQHLSQGEPMGIHRPDSSICDRQGLLGLPNES